MDKSPPKPPPRTAMSKEAKTFYRTTTTVSPHDKTMQPDTPVDKMHQPEANTGQRCFASQVNQKIHKYLQMFGRTRDQQPPKEDLTQFKLDFIRH